MITKLTKCRICGNDHLPQVLDLGEQMLTGIFPKHRDAKVTTGPLQLVKCSGGENTCGLLQLAHSYDLGEMYGDDYGYRSGLNASMVAHLKHKIDRIRNRVILNPGDLVIDIGSNDSTTLRAYHRTDLTLVGVDPTGRKFQEFYPDHVTLIPDFFSAERVRQRFPNLQAKVVTSFSMFYDLPAPMAFMAQVRDILAEDGIWVFEQSYMPTMLKTNSYDTVCHEHLEFYALHQIQWMAEKVGLQIVDVEFNDINGGSFSVTAIKTEGTIGIKPAVQKILDDERQAGLHTLEPYEEFARRVETSRKKLLNFIADLKLDGKRVVALGASTKGNVLLQYCGLNETDIEVIAEVNPDKFDAFTPGSFIPIIPQDEVIKSGADYYIVLPWHFRSFFETSPTFKGLNLVFPLPELEVFSS